MNKRAPMLCPRCKKSFAYMEALRRGMAPTVGRRWAWTGRVTRSTAGGKLRNKVELRCLDCRYIWWSYQPEALELAGVSPPAGDGGIPEKPA